MKFSLACNTELKCSDMTNVDEKFYVREWTLQETVTPLVVVDVLASKISLRPLINFLYLCDLSLQPF